MDATPEYVVKAKAWPAYVLVAVLVVMVPLYAVMVVLMLGSEGSPVLGLLAVIVIAGGLVQVAATIWAIARVLRVVRHPPRLSPAGLRMWSLATSAYVPLPWDRVLAVRLATKGLGRGMFVYVDDPEGLAGDDPAARRRIRREMRRLLGTPLVCPLPGGDRRLAEIDAALRGFSGGRLALTRGAPVGGSAGP